MSAIRDEIRAILREEIAALRSEIETSVETVRITSSAELNRFARDLITRASSPEFASQVATGQLTFALATNGAFAGGAKPSQTEMRSQTKTAAQTTSSLPTLEKQLITERDIAALEQATRSLRLSKHSRLTPLARDEAQRRGIRIERISS